MSHVHPHTEDTIGCVQVGDAEFVTLESFLNSYRDLLPTEFDEVIQGYAVIVFKTERVLKCFVTGTSRLPKMIRVEAAHRGAYAMSVYRDEVAQIYQ